MRAPTKEGKTILLRRPLKCLYPLEFNSGVGGERALGDEVSRGFWLIRLSMRMVGNFQEWAARLRDQMVVTTSGTKANSLIEAVMGDEN